MAEIIQMDINSDAGPSQKLQFTEQSLGSRLIRHLFKKGVFNDRLGPAKAMQMHPEFLKYGIGGFRGRFYKERRRYKSNTLPAGTIFANHFFIFFNLYNHLLIQNFHLHRERYK